MKQDAHYVIENAPKAFFCIFDKAGTHHIIDQLNKIPSEDQFRERAFSVAAERLGVPNEPTRVPPGSTAISATNAGPKWPLVVTAIAALLVLLFPPYAENFMSPRGHSLSGHGGWKFIFETGKYNTRFETETISIGLWLLEFIVVAVIGAILWRFTRRR